MERLYMRRELYFSIMLDRASNGPVIVASTRGGTSIEDVAESTPEAILKMPVDIAVGVTDAQLDKLVEDLGFSGSVGVQVCEGAAETCVPSSAFVCAHKSYLLYAGRPNFASLTCTRCLSARMRP
jgi:hypothetical protein